MGKARLAPTVIRLSIRPKNTITIMVENRRRRRGKACLAQSARFAIGKTISLTKNKYPHA
jgi:hypothetical protein